MPMKSPAVRLLRGLATAAVLLALPAPARASSDSGFELTVGRFTLRVTYVDVLDYEDHAERAIQDPRRLLYTAAALIQANRAAFADVDAVVWAELGQVRGDASTRLWIHFDDARTGAHVTWREGPAPKDVERELVRVLCGHVPGACAVEPRAFVELFPCAAGAPCAARIDFGALPSPVTKAPRALVAPAPGVRGERVSRAQMTRYFDVLQ